MSRAITKQEFNQRTLLQADKLITNACETRKMLLEFDKELLPFTLRSAIRKSTTEREIIESYLQEVFSSQGKKEKNSIESPPPFQEVHRNFTTSADRLANISNSLNKSLTIEPDPVQ